MRFFCGALAVAGLVGLSSISLAIIRLGTAGYVAVWCDMPAVPGGQTHFILDVVGYFE